jgi:hypothetical protein
MAAIQMDRHLKATSKDELRPIRDGSLDMTMAVIQMDRHLKATSKDKCPHCELPMELSGQSWVSQDGKVCCTRDCAVAVYAG